MKLLVSVLLFFVSLNLIAQKQDSTSIRVFMDLQIHPTMHVPYPFFGKGLTYKTKAQQEKLSYKHRFRNVNYADFYKGNAGARIFVNGALNTEWVCSRARARRVILKQIQYIDDFVAKNSNDFAVAKSPEELRYYVNHTQKTIFIHSIEGGKKLINSQADADFWAEKGVAFVTLVHLIDSEYGSAAVMPRLAIKILNFWGNLKPETKRRLKPKGKEAILFLANAGIMTDITHMSDQTRADALNFMQEHKIPPIATHSGYKPIQNHAMGLSQSEIIQIYQNKGFVSLPISGESLTAFHPQATYYAKLDSNYEEGTIDSYRVSYSMLKEFIESSVDTLSQGRFHDFGSLSEKDKVNFAIGFQSDFNGWINHSKPKTKGQNKDSVSNHFYRVGMAHPGLLSEHWKELENQNVDLQPILRSSERFVALWEYFLSRKGQLK